MQKLKTTLAVQSVLFALLAVYMLLRIRLLLLCFR